MVKDGDGGVAGEDEIAVHAVDDKVARYRVLCCRKSLRDHGAAIYASRSGWVPQRSSVGEDVLNGERRSGGRFHGGLQETGKALETHGANVYESCEVEDILDWGLARVDGWRLDEGGSRHTGGRRGVQVARSCYRQILKTDQLADGYVQICGTMDN